MGSTEHGSEFARYERIDVEENELVSSKRSTIGIIGHGNFGTALACRLRALGLNFCVGTRKLAGKRFDETELSIGQILNNEEAVLKSDIIVMAVPAHAYGEFSQDFYNLLAGKIVVDISNAAGVSDPCYAEKLAQLSPNSRVVKAFNTLSSWSMQNDIYGASRTTFVCGDDPQACKTVMHLAQKIGFTPIELGRLSAARLLEKKTLAFFPEWKLAFWMTVFLLILTTAYVYLRCFIYLNISMISIYAVMPIANAVTGCMVLLLLIVVFMPGSLAGLMQLTRGEKYRSFPNWLDAWLKGRKQLGLFALLFASIHACVSLILLAGEYYAGMSQVYEIKGTGQLMYHRFRWNAELSLLFATLSLTVLSIQGVTSLPTVNESLSWREWDFIQSKLGYLGLLFGFLHVVFYAGKVMTLQSISRWKHGIPHQLFLLLLLAFFVMVLKLFLNMPFIGSRIRKIRSEWEMK